MNAIDMNESFFEKILQAHEKNNKIKVLEVSKNIATAKGDNYLSNIYRVVIKYNKDDGKCKTNEECSLIVKLKTNQVIFGEIETSHFFKTEIYVFEKLLPRIEKYVGCTIAPFHYFFNTDDEYIVLEDLKAKGYAMADKFKGLSFEHCLEILEKIAKFHAGSVAIYEKEPNLLEAFDSFCNYNNLPENFFKFLQSSLISLSDNIEKTWKEKEYQGIASKLRNLVNTIKDKLLIAFNHDPDEFCALNHGDLWLNNLMFKTDHEGKQFDTILIDYQIVSYTSPAIDLHHFLASFPPMEMLGKNDEYFLETYLTILTNTLKKIGCKTKAPTMEQLKKAIYKRRICSVIVGLIYMPSLLADKIQHDINDVNVFDVPIAVELVHKITKFYLNKGYLD